MYKYDENHNQQEIAPLFSMFFFPLMLTPKLAVSFVFFSSPTTRRTKKKYKFAAIYAKAQFSLIHYYTGLYFSFIKVIMKHGGRNTKKKSY